MWPTPQVVDPWEPRPRTIYHKSDAELWQVRQAGMELAWRAGRLMCLPGQRVPASLLPSSQNAPRRPIQYSFPFMEDTVPLWAVPFLALYLPLLVLVAAHLVRQGAQHLCLPAAASGIGCYLLRPPCSPLSLQAGWISRTEAHHACLNLFACVATAGFLGNLLKSQVHTHTWATHAIKAPLACA